MSEAPAPLAGIVLAHEAVATAFVAAVEAIAGTEHGLVPVSNAGCDRAAIEARLAAAIAGRPAVIFADLPGGSCAFGAAAYARSHPSIAVVTGVNLAMLLDFAFHRAATPEAARERAVATGRSAIGAPGGPAAQAPRGSAG
jgi:mannose/fructose-specific phosphotransferase system component IIA